MVRCDGELCEYGYCYKFNNEQTLTTKYLNYILQGVNIYVKIWKIKEKFVNEYIGDWKWV